MCRKRKLNKRATETAHVPDTCRINSQGEINTFLKNVIKLVNKWRKRAVCVGGGGDFLAEGLRMYLKKKKRKVSLNSRA